MVRFNAHEWARRYTRRKKSQVTCAQAPASPWKLICRAQSRCNSSWREQLDPLSYDHKRCVSCWLPPGLLCHPSKGPRYAAGSGENSRAEQAAGSSSNMSYGLDPLSYSHKGYVSCGLGSGDGGNPTNSEDTLRSQAPKRQKTALSSARTRPYINKIRKTNPWGS